MLGIESLELQNFRNYISGKFDFGARRILLSGKNGAGKSNLLEAISFLSLLHSFRGASIREMLYNGISGNAMEFKLHCRLNTKVFSEDLFVCERINGPIRRELRIGNSEVKRAGDFIQEFRTIIFAPEDRNLTSGSSGCRRRYLNILISVLDNRYFTALCRYQRALEQRNRALKMHSENIAASFEPELAEDAAFITFLCREYLERITAIIKQLLNGNYEFGSSLRSVLPADISVIREFLARNRRNDLKRGITSSGPHLDEVDFSLNGLDLRHCGSTGQHRLISLLLRLAEFVLVRDKCRVPVVVLADDVTGELDAKNRRLFFNNISSADQIFFAAAEQPSDDFFDKCLQISL